MATESLDSGTDMILDPDLIQSGAWPTDIWENWAEPPGVDAPQTQFNFGYEAPYPLQQDIDLNATGPLVNFHANTAPTDLPWTDPSVSSDDHELPPSPTGLAQAYSDQPSLDFLPAQYLTFEDEQVYPLSCLQSSVVPQEHSLPTTSITPSLDSRETSPGSSFTFIMEDPTDPSLTFEDEQIYQLLQSSVVPQEHSLPTTSITPSLDIRKTSPERSFTFIIEDPTDPNPFREKRRQTDMERAQQKEDSRRLKAIGGACMSCYEIKKKCDLGDPCAQCVRNGKICVRKDSCTITSSATRHRPGHKLVSL